MQEPAKRFTNIMNTILSGESFSIISFQDRPSGSKKSTGIDPYAVKRTRDGVTFTIDDTVTNGLRSEGRLMKGKITGFHILEGEMFVDHTWSGVGMNLESLRKVVVLPSKHQIDDFVWLNLGVALMAQVHGVHFYSSKVKYDLIVLAGDANTRIYNVDEVFVGSKD